ncbi:hypothetical protein [Lacunimicrobium album]
MAVTQEQLDKFHQFASDYLRSADETLTMDDLLVEWESLAHRSEINAAIQEGLDDINAGRTRPAREVTQEIRRSLGI